MPHVTLLAVLQALGFMVSSFITGFVYGHESCISFLHQHAPDFDRKRPPWKQPESYKRAKSAARSYFPLFWYWGNARVGAGLFALFAVVDLTSGTFTPGTLAAAVVAGANHLLYTTSPQPRWQNDPQEDERK